MTERSALLSHYAAVHDDGPVACGGNRDTWALSAKLHAIGILRAEMHQGVMYWVAVPVTNLTDWQKDVFVPCQSCGAAAGDSCVEKNGKPMHIVHIGRRLQRLLTGLR